MTTLIQDDEDDGPVQELTKFASSYTDEVLKYLVSEMSPSLSKVSILFLASFGYILCDNKKYLLVVILCGSKLISAD